MGLQGGAVVEGPVRRRLDNQWIEAILAPLWEAVPDCRLACNVFLPINDIQSKMISHFDEYHIEVENREASLPCRRFIFERNKNSSWRG